MALDITVDTLNSASAVVAIHGSLTLGSNLKMVEGQVQQLIEEGVKKLVLDLTDCQYSDSAGLGFLIHTYGLISAQGGTVRLCGVSERVMELLRMTKTDALMPCDADRQVSIGKL
jgi:anti-sigma B factor antagonist